MDSEACRLITVPEHTKTAAIVIQIAVLCFSLWLFSHAKKQGRRWVSTFAAGTLFGWAAEAMIVNGNFGETWYEYCGDVFPVRAMKVPVAVALGWGSILYATWTSQRLNLPVLLRPFAASALAINIDLTLDPVAANLHFWSWFNLGKDGKPVHISSIAEGHYYGVPYDNFLGWFLIVAIYGASVRWMFATYDRIKGHMSTDAMRTRSRGRGGREPDAADVLVPLAAGALGLLLMWSIKTFTVAHVYAAFPSSMIFIVSLPLVLIASWLFGRNASRSEPVALPIIWMPVFYHGFAYAMLFVCAWNGKRESDTLMVAISFTAFAGFLAFAWPSLDLLLPTARKKPSS